MTMIHNGVEVKSVIYNGTDLDKVINNGVTVFEKAPSADPVFANNTPEQIQAAVRAGIASTLWRVGDKIPIKLKGTVGNLSLNGTYYAYIIGFDHNKALESGGAHNIHLQFAKTSGGTVIAFADSKYGGNCGGVNGFFSMNATNTTSGGWKSCQMRTNICSAFFNVLPTEWQYIITECTKYSDNVGNGNGTASAVTATQDKIWLPAQFEIYGTRSLANQYEQNKQVQYSVFADTAGKQKYKHDATTTGAYWWSRSTNGGSNTAWCDNRPNGTVTSSYANLSRAFAPCFQIS